MLKTDQYKTSKHGYVTKTQQQKGLATFLSAKLKVNFPSRRRLNVEIGYTDWRHLDSTAAATIVQRSC